MKISEINEKNCKHTKTYFKCFEVTDLYYLVVGDLVFLNARVEFGMKSESSLSDN